MDIVIVGVLIVITLKINVDLIKSVVQNLMKIIKKMKHFVIVINILGNYLGFLMFYQVNINF